MSRIDDICRKVVTEVDGAIACGVVDLESGMLMGIHNVAQYTSSLNELVAASAVDMFRGRSVSQIERMVRQHKGLVENGEHYFQEIHIKSLHNHHFMKTLKGGNGVLVLVTRLTTSAGLAWAQVRIVLPDIEKEMP